MAASSKGRLLVVCGDQSEALLLADRYRSLGWEVEIAHRGASALALLRTDNYAAVITDIVLPDTDGLEVLRKIREDNQDTAVILLARHDACQYAAEAFWAGADHYVQKPVGLGHGAQEQLQHILNCALEARRRRSEERRMIRGLERRNRELEKELEAARRWGSALLADNKRLAELCVRDTLTGLPNRSELETQLRRELAFCDRHGHPLALALLDLDYFRTYNNAMGKEAGDQVLIEIADLIQGNVRASDAVFRYDGEEFVVLFRGTGLAMGAHAAERLRAIVEQRYFEGQEALPGGNLSASIGVAAHPQQSATADDLLAKAEAAVKSAKQAGRNRVEIYTDGVLIPGDESPA